MEHVEEVETKLRKKSKISLNSKGDNNNLTVISSNHCNNIHIETCNSNTTRDSSNGNSKNSMESNEGNLKIKKYSVYTNNTNNTNNSTTSCEYSDIRKNSMKENKEKENKDKENKDKENKVKPAIMNKIKETKNDFIENNNRSDSQTERKYTNTSSNSIKDENSSKYDSLE